MLAILVFIIFSAFNSSFGEGPKRSPPTSILGGLDYVAENNYHLSLNLDGIHICSAALLKTPYDKMVAITAASCLTSNKAKEYTVTFWKVRPLGDEGDDFCVLTKLKLYEDYDKQTLNNDIALLFSDDITSTGGCDVFINNTLGVILANSTTSREHVKVTGWDDTTDTLKIIEDEMCWKPDVCNEQFLTEKNFTIGSTMLCHGVPNEDREPNNCRAERGSPVVAVPPENPPALVAVTSWTIAAHFMDESWYPCVGTGVFDDSIKKWIESEIEEFAIR